MKRRKAQVSKGTAVAAAVAAALSCGTAGASSLSVSGGLNAIDGSGTNAIDGSGTNAIDGSGRDAIDGSGTEAIDGSGRDAIDGSGTNAIDGSGTNAIDGSGRDAIDGSGTEAIDGSGRDAIDGSGTNAIDGSGTNAIDGSGSNGHAVDSFAQLLVGPVEGFDYQNETMQVLGQKVMVLANTKFGHDKEAIVEGDLVAVAGLAFDGGIVASRIATLAEMYVAGATQLSVSGVIRAVDSTLGRIQIGSLWVDVSATDINTSDVSAGDFITVRGTQPLANGVLLAE